MIKKIKKVFFVLTSIVFVQFLFSQTTSVQTLTQINQLTQSASVGSAKSSLTPNPQLALSTSDYLVTAGDVYSLAFIVGSSPVTYSIPIDSTYKIRVANLAVINVAGKTFNQLKTQIEEIVTKNYPMSGVQFAIVSPAVFKVTIEGEVKETKIKQAWALSRLSDILDDDFLTEYSSDRDIVIQSANGTKKTYDMFKAERFGDLSQNPYVRPDDKIIINKIKRSVKISGAVERPGTYTLLENENLKKLLDYYGGSLTDYADTSRIELVRYNAENISNKAIYLNQKSIDDDFVLENHDSITIFKSTDLLPIMFIEGAVNNSSNMADLETSTKVSENNIITVKFNPDTNYAYLVRTYENYFQDVSDLQKAYIIRGDTVINIDLTKILYDRSFYSDETVLPNDRLMIPFKQNFISVAGAVRAPGRYPYIPGRDWEYYIGLAGGFDRSMNSGKKVKITDIDGKKLSKKDAITPETTITAETNSFTYFFKEYSNIILTFLSLVTSVISLVAIFRD